VGLKESLLSHMEGAAVTEEKIEERALAGGEQATALARTAADLDVAIRELEQVAAADSAQTEAIAADLRAQIETLRADLARTGVEQRAFEEQTAAYAAPWHLPAAAASHRTPRHAAQARGARRGRSRPNGR
jgi:hypothetical protein